VKVRVYRNLRRADWSVMDPNTGRVVGHLAELVLLDVVFIVSERVRLRVLAQQRRTVHAYAQGTLSDLSVRGGGYRLHYNPFTSGAFWAAGQIITSAARVDFRPDGAFVDREAA
jgi:hypothetical protein